jgi:hypothetical protein
LLLSLLLLVLLMLEPVPGAAAAAELAPGDDSDTAIEFLGEEENDGRPQG